MSIDEMSALSAGGFATGVRSRSSACAPSSEPGRPPFDYAPIRAETHTKLSESTYANYLRRAGIRFSGFCGKGTFDAC